MAGQELYSALEVLRPTDFTNIPLDQLSTYLKDVFTKSALIANSVPVTPNGDDQPCDPASRITEPANFAHSAKELKPSAARPHPAKLDNLADLHKQWGKPLKVGQKDNPLGVTVWKMAGHDRHGAWFARKSVHAGLGFDKWKRAIKKEFATSRAVEGGPGAGAVRGIGADRLVVKEEVEGVGKMEVWHLSAQFPGPVAPREFLTMLLTSEEEFGQAEGGGRTYMMVSIPVEHDDAPIKSGLVRGYYESVEMIREIPIVPPPKHGDAKSAATEATGDSSEDPETNPVEWMMITRSDPGGGIPRFMVERSTPASITADTVKFIDWATKVEDFPESDDEEHIQQQEKAEEHVKAAPGEFVQKPAPPDPAASTTVKQPSAPGVPIVPVVDPSSQDLTSQEPSSSGILASIAGAVSSSVGAYVPNPVLEHLPTALFTHAPGTYDEAYDSDTSSTASSSVHSFESALPYTTAEEAAPGGPLPRKLSDSSSSTENPLASKSDASLALLTLPTNHGAASPNSTASAPAGKTAASEEKELRKLIDRKRELDAKFAARIERDAKRREEMASKSTREAEKKRDRLAREERKTADRYAREIAKIEERQRKEQRRIETKKRKQEDKDRMARVERERDEAVQGAETLKKENEGLKGQVGELQRELTLLVKEVGKLPGGAVVLEQVKEEILATPTPRAGSPVSERSRKSRVSIDSKTSLDVKRESIG